MNRLEIERTFVVDPEQLPQLPTSERMVQAYLGFEPVVRVRIVDDQQAWMSVKGPGLMIRVEIEFPIPVEEARQLLELRAYGSNVVEKTRHRVDVNGHIWEVDVFEGTLAGLVLAEVELDGIDDIVDIPPWAVREVSRDSRYHNVSLARNGLPGEE